MLVGTCPDGIIVVWILLGIRSTVCFFERFPRECRRLIEFGSLDEGKLAGITPRRGISYAITRQERKPLPASNIGGDSGALVASRNGRRDTDRARLAA